MHVCHKNHRVNGNAGHSKCTQLPNLISHIALASYQDYTLYISMQFIRKIRGWAEKFIGWLWCNGRMWPNVVLFCNIVSPAVHTLLPSVLQGLDSHGIEALILILEKGPQLQIWPHHQSNNASQPSVFSLWGTENSQMVPFEENMEGDQPPQRHRHPQQPLQPQTCVQEHCPRETGPPSSVFQTVSKMSLVLLFKVMNYLSSVGYLDGNNAVSIRKGWI